MTPRTINELLDINEPAWPEIVNAINKSSTTIQVLPITQSQGEEKLLELQVTTHSTLGAITYHTGGIIIDNWLRILGGGYRDFPDIPAASNLQFNQIPPYLVIATDIIGGIYVLDGGGLGVRPGAICYYGPEDSEWYDTGFGHTDFIHWAIDGTQLDNYYGGVRWNAWKEDTKNITLSQGVSIVPPPSTVEGKDPELVSHKIVPFKELINFYGLGDIIHF